MSKSVTKKPKSTRKKLFPRKHQMLRRVLIGLGIGIAAITAIIATLHCLPLFIALLSALGLCAAIAIARRLADLSSLHLSIA
ncbi:MAG: hypothetical protein ABMA26_00630 [Limisphaerales bacterium]